MLHLNALIRSRLLRSSSDEDDGLDFLSNPIPEEKFREKDMVRLHLVFDCIWFLIGRISNVLLTHTDSRRAVEQVEVQSETSDLIRDFLVVP